MNLIAEHSGRATSLSEWKFNLAYLQEQYEKIIAISGVKKLYVDQYIEDYKMVWDTEHRPTTYTNTEHSYIPYAATYSKDNAIHYANVYCKNYNSNYPNWRSYGGDCANFVSQCLYAGGKLMHGTPGTSTEAQNWNNWFSKGNVCNTKNVSSTWRGANAFKSYWQSHTNGYSKFSSVGVDSYYYGTKGDAVSLLNSNGRAYHTLLIVGYDFNNRDFILASHTGDTIDAKLRNYAAPGGFIIFKMN